MSTFRLLLKGQRQTMSVAAAVAVFMQAAAVSAQPLPTMTLDTTPLTFGATSNGAAFVVQTSAQIALLTQSGVGTVSWTATTSQPWLQVSPAAGTGGAELSISVRSVTGLPISGTLTGSVSLTFSGATNPTASIPVTLNIMPNGTSQSPFGFIDTPLNNTTGVVGAIPVTGWALDDVEIASLTICRLAVVGEPVGPDARCGGNAQIFVGNGVFIEGARPDVRTSFPTYPRNHAGGWGFMVLTNMLPNQGNGVTVFSFYVTDREGHLVGLGSRTITCDNANATKPFGTIDTPGQGDRVSGSQYVNFGWALTQADKFIPFDGSTIQVLIDGVARGTVDYNHFRVDIATFFPGLANSNGAIGFRIIDTTALTNGLHTIVWFVSDASGNSEGLGSRFFRVSNSSGGVSASGATRTATSGMGSQQASAAIAAAPADQTPIVARRGWQADSAWRSYGIAGAERAVLRGEEVDRFEIELGEHIGERYAGYLRVGSDLAALPVGSHLNAETGDFTWSPGAGFIGTYDLVFVRSAGDHMTARQEVRIVLQPKGSEHGGVDAVIDAPAAHQVLHQPFALGGWAIDRDAEAGTGIDTLHVWAFPTMGGSPIFLGTAGYGGARPDVASIYGTRFRPSGYGLTVDGLPPGTYDLAVFAWSNVSSGFAPARVVRVTVR